MAFARLWAGGVDDASTPDLEDDVRVLCGPDIAPEIPAEMKDPEIVIADMNWQAVDIFCGSITQWNYGWSGRTGLNYPGVEMVMRAYGVDDQADCLRRVFVIEAEVLKIDSERRRAAEASKSAHRA